MIYDDLNSSATPEWHLATELLFSKRPLPSDGSEEPSILFYEDGFFLRYQQRRAKVQHFQCVDKMKSTGSADLNGEHRHRASVDSLDWKADLIAFSTQPKHIE